MVDYFSCVLQFLTNIFLIPYMALRLLPDDESPKAKSELPDWAPILGAAGFIFGNLSLAWLGFGRPEFGDLAARAQYALNSAGSDRV